MNAIPRMCQAAVACGSEQVAAVKQAIADTARVIRNEFRSTDPAIDVRIEEDASAVGGRCAITTVDTAKVVDLLTALPSGAG